MRLRNRLLLFSTAKLLTFGALFALAYGSFEYSVLPMFQSLLRAKCEQIARMAGAELDVPLGADDQSMLVRSVSGILSDPDFAYLAVRNVQDQIVFSQGTPPDAPLFAGVPYAARAGDGHIHAWATVSLEGLKLGTVAVAFSTARIDQVVTWAHRIAVCFLLIWLVVLGHAITFSRSFVSPIRAMMDFSRKVAGGQDPPIQRAERRGLRFRPSGRDAALDQGLDSLGV